MIDSIHHAAHTARGSSLAAAQEMLANTQVDQDRRFFTALEAILEVLPFPRPSPALNLKATWRHRETTSRLSTTSSASPTATRSTSPGS